MKHADKQSIRQKDNSRKELKIKIELLEDKCKMEKEMRENLEYAIDEISTYLFTSLEELTTNARQLEKRNIELEIQDKIVKIINKEINLQNVLKTLLQQAIYLFPHGDKGAFLQNDVLSNHFQFAAIEGYAADALEAVSLNYEDVVTIMTKNVQQLDQGIFVINQFDIETTLQQSNLATTPNSVIAIVLSLENKLDDFLILDIMSDLKGFDQQDIKNLARFREHAISAISKAKMLELLQQEKEKTEKALDITQQANRELEIARKKLEEMSLTDTLTKLRNRRFLGTFIDSEIGQTLRKYYDWIQGHRTESPRKADLIFYMLDIDYFKWVNDTFGHDSGDRVLEQVSQILKTECRDSDIVIRWGGEEFLIVSLKADQDKAYVLPERIRTTIEKHSFEIENGKTINRTCSIGFACYPFMTPDIKAFDYQQIISIADKCLYIAKTSGRNGSVGIQSNEITPRKNLLEKINSQFHTLVQNREIQIFTSGLEIKNLPS